MSLGALGKRMAAALGLEIRRAGHENRFEAMAHTLSLLRHRGFRPTFVVDAGANVGKWTRMASAMFSEARFALVEPQHGCRPALDALGPPRFRVHHVALTKPGVTEVRMASAGGQQKSTGTFVADAVRELSPETDVVVYPAATLDDLFAREIQPSDRVLLKLDLEGHELVALSGAEALLPRVEVVVCELTFFDVNRAGQRVVFTDIFKHFDARGFELYDFASLLGRSRDQRLNYGDGVFVRRGSPLLEDVAWR